MFKSGNYETRNCLSMDDCLTNFILTLTEYRGTCFPSLTHSHQGHCNFYSVVKITIYESPTNVIFMQKYLKALCANELKLKSYQTEALCLRVNEESYH